MKSITWICICLISISVRAQQLNIIPQPAEVKTGNGFLSIKQPVAFIYNDDVPQNFGVSFFKDYLKKFYKITQFKEGSEHSYGFPTEIFVDYEEDFQPKDGYALTVDAKGISVAGNEQGLFYAFQTLIQLLPVPNPTNSKIQIPFVTIKDKPKFAYRGMHLDVCRHFFPISYVKKYIDYLALHKFNYFHWHLTEDQGWRIEIKKYPQLTKVGAWRNGTIIGRYPGTGSDNKPYGGFYTQAEVKEIVKYAADRFITVIPEIEMPGHSSAAIAAYPYLSCFPNEPTKIPATMISKKSLEQQKNGRIKLVQETWGVFDDVYCAGKDSTFKFLQDVMDEVLALFPSKLIHVGGDESPKANWKRCPFCQKRIKDEGLKDEHELQSYFIQRMEKYLNSKGRTIIGWDEILEGGLAPNAAVMSWRGEEGGIAAAKQNHDVVMTPGGWCYFDHSQSQHEDSVTIGSYLPIEKVYSYNPIPASLSDGEAKHILGAQANLWTEYIKNTRKVEYMIFPRMAALSEVLWSQKKDSADFERRLLTQFKRYDLWKANYSKAYFNISTSVVPTADRNGVKWKFASKLPNVTFDAIIRAGDPIPTYRNVTEADIYHSSTNTVLMKLGNKQLSELTQRFEINKATGKIITLATPASSNYPGDGPFTLVDGIWNAKGRAQSQEFLGFNGKDCEATIDFGSVQKISNVKAHVFEQKGSWIWGPKSLQVLISVDGNNYSEMGTTDVLQFNDSTKTNGILTVQKNVEARYLKVKLVNVGMIAAGNAGAGNPAWLFVDEIEVN